MIQCSINNKYVYQHFNSAQIDLYKYTHTHTHTVPTLKIGVKFEL